MLHRHSTGRGIVMKGLTKVQSFMLYALGTYQEEFSRRFEGRPVTMVLNKVDFIDLVHKTKIASKKDRAVYKNLQDLEEQRYVSYEHKTLALTKRGGKEFVRIKRDISPYVIVAGVLGSDDIMHYTKKAQTVLVQEK